MSIIMISRGSYSRGSEIAEKVAITMGYTHVSRDSLIENIEELNSRDAKLVQSIEDVPSLFARFQHGKEAYIACIQSTLLHQLSGDNVVYEGFVGHVFLKDIPNVLKVRIISDYEDRTNIVAERDDISKERALQLIKKIDEQRRKWSQYLYAIDPADSNQYDIVFNVTQIPVENVVNTLAQIAGLEQFQLTNDAKKKMNDLALAAKLKNTLLSNHRGVEVLAKDGKVFVSTAISNSDQPAFVSEIEKLMKHTPSIKEVELDFQISVPLSQEKIRETVVIPR